MQINIWGLTLEDKFLEESQKIYLDSLPKELPSVKWVWEEMDRVWDSFNLDNKKPLSNQPIGKYYSHPVWIMNGIFTSIDPESNDHREAITQYIREKNLKDIADYGGGFAELAIKISKISPSIQVTIIEPYLSSTTKERIKDNLNIKKTDILLEDIYDAVIVQDVLEHVEDPVELAFQISKSLKKGGIVIFANCFNSCIKCHLPSTFHLRHNFPLVMAAMGLKYNGTIKGAPHAQIFTNKNNRLNINRARKAESTSKIIGPLHNKFRIFLSRIKRITSI